MTTLDPLNTNGDIALSNGNLTATKGGSNSWRTSVAEGPELSTGRFVVEATCNLDLSTGNMFGFGPITMNLGSYVGSQATSYGLRSDGRPFNNAVNGTDTNYDWRDSSNWSHMMLAIDFDAGEIYAYWRGEATLVHTFTPNTPMVPAISLFNSGGESSTLNFGATPFKNNIPPGYSSWDGNQSNNTVGLVAGITDSPVVVLENNLRALLSGNGNWKNTYSSIRHGSGKYVFEVIAGNEFQGSSQRQLVIGVTPAFPGANIHVGGRNDAYALGQDGVWLKNNTADGLSPGATYENPGDAIMFLCDFDNGTFGAINSETGDTLIKWYDNGDFNTGLDYYAGISLKANLTAWCNVNFGATPFRIPIPRGYQSWDGSQFGGQVESDVEVQQKLAHLRFDTDNVTDEVGTLVWSEVGSPSNVAGLFGNSLEITNVDGQYVESDVPLLPEYGDWTMEVWLWLDAYATAEDRNTFFSQYTGGANGRTTFVVAEDSQGGDVGVFIEGGTGSTEYTGVRVPLNQWVHVVIQRGRGDAKDADRLRVWQDGVQTLAIDIGGNNIEQTNARIGGILFTDRGWDGKIDDFVVYDRALYAAGVDFTPPTAPVPDPDNALRYYDRDAGKKIAHLTFDVDNVTDEVGIFTWSEDGTPVNTAGKFGNAIETGPDKLNYIVSDVPVLPEFGPWTFEAWLYLDAFAADKYSTFLAQYAPSPTDGRTLFFASNPSDGQVLGFFMDDGTVGGEQFGSITFPLDKWVHVVVQRDSNNDVVMWQDGQISLSHNVGANNILQIPARIGSVDYPPADRGWEGLIDDVTIYSEAIYDPTVDFHPPTRAAPVDSEILIDDLRDLVVFHFPFNELASPVENTVDNATYALNGSSALTHDNAMFARCADFTTGNGIGIPNSNWPGLGASDFTVEMWAFVPSGAFPMYGRVFQQADGDVFGVGLTWGRDDVTSDTVQVNGTSTGAGFDMFTREIANGWLLDEWAHYAVSRVSDQWYFTRNGVIIDEWTASGTLYYDTLATTIIGGQTVGTARPFGGLMDEFRITIGQSRFGFGGRPVGPFPQPWGLVANNPPFAVFDPPESINLDLWDGPQVAYSQNSASGEGYGTVVIDIDQPFAIEFEILEHGDNTFNGRSAVGVTTRTSGAIDLQEGVYLRSNGQLYDFGSVSLNSTWEMATGDIITVISDGSGIWIGRNGLWRSGVGSDPVPDPVTGVNPTVDDLTLSGPTFRAVYWTDNVSARPAARLNAGQEPFIFVPEAFAAGMQADPDVQDIDHFFDNVVSLYAFDDADGSTTFADASQRGVTATQEGTAVTDDQNQLHGNNLLLTAPGGAARIAGNSVFNFGGRPFTIECRFMIEADSPVDTFSQRNGSLVNAFGNSFNGDLEGWNLMVVGDAVTTGTGLIFSSWAPGAGANANQWFADGLSLNKNQWYTLAYCREADQTEHLFLDGVELSAVLDVVGSGFTGVTNIGDTLIGETENTTNTWPFYGRIDEVRITRDHCRYTTDYDVDGFPFDQTTKEDPFYNSVVSLHHYDEVVGIFSLFTDEQGGVWNQQGTTSQYGEAQFGVGVRADSGRGILQFTGAKSEFNFLHEGLEDWTFEMSITATNTGSDQMIVDTGGIANSAIGIGLYRRNSGSFGFAVGNGTGTYVVQIEAGTLLTDGTTYQLAVTHEVGVGYTIYIDGVEIATAAGNGNEVVADSTYDMILGAWGGGGSLVYRGSWDEVRITRGVARYA